MAHLQVHRTTLTQVNLKFAVLAHKINIAFISTLRKTRKSLSLPSVYIFFCLVYISQQIFSCHSLIVMYFETLKISISHSILKSTKQLKIFKIFFKSLLFRSNLQGDQFRKVFNTLWCGFFSAYLQHILRTPFHKNTFGGLLLCNC